jgi:hypothetical protein
MGLPYLVVRDITTLQAQLGKPSRLKQLKNGHGKKKDWNEKKTKKNTV